ncbi:hypothetical protein A3206_03235 [Candidatus Methanomassiliicoccus intestinalis]|jgi:hypothetical protein|uniref:Uncharacterized protein n=1 Tax=Methanomassiliicoccus intestinalis (strain Issoire-Mx1) TaxID=1295009 RepID=R9T840_METII|nr:hypothetical protein [Candidatus Methanomassiliicoccus intestinalis]AGN26880.1 hypothetical protein MMINT_15730 [Candidatus Methanomassiliicoccus intestinalis Issoire-Mx1]TQS83854.1 MAG: hypothetical protein A3206_03235 [Candidatus Methanomassiliicoccus intestinalis]
MKEITKENVTLLDVLVSLPDSSSVNGITPAKLSIKYNISEMSSKRALDILVEMGLASVLECETYIESSESEDFLRVLNALQLSLVG